MQTTVSLIVAALTVASLTGCSDNTNQSAPAPVATVTATVTAEPSPVLEPPDVGSLTVAEKRFARLAWARGLGFIEESYLLDAGHGVCDSLPRNPSISLVETSKRAVMKGVEGAVTRRQIDDLYLAAFETLCPEVTVQRPEPPKPKPVTFGDGTWRVGADVPTGVYRVAAADDYCVWYRLNKMSSGTDSSAIISWGWADGGDPVLATISAGDVAFQSMGCGIWKKVG